MPGTRSHESPPSWLLNNDAGSTPHHRSFLPLPASSDQMLASARPSSLGNAGPEFVSWKLSPMSVERNIFMPKNGLQLEAYRRGVPRVSISVEYTGTPGPNGPRSSKLLRGFAASATNTPFLVPMVRMTRSAIFSLLTPPAGWSPRPPDPGPCRARHPTCTAANLFGHRGRSVSDRGSQVCPQLIYVEAGAPELRDHGLARRGTIGLDRDNPDFLLPMIGHTESVRFAGTPAACDA